MTSGRRARSQRGMVTVELAIGVLTAALLTACLAGLSLLGVAQAAAGESSAQIARQTARGDDAAVELARERVPDGAAVEVSQESDGVRVAVVVPVAVPLLGRFTVSADSWAAYEPGVGP
ncbi:hypothetical protein TESS_TESS_00779 [Tessaracoccus sp. O5.2]|nr:MULTISPECIES: TadE family type IV pilus minor pilin [Tessaracoccus]VEP40929.1 hypothetical protein TLA_TLA_02152 [Tessaracoccus lapidicaptus]